MCTAQSARTMRAALAAHALVFLLASVLLASVVAAAAQAAEPGYLELDRRACDSLVEHVPDAGVAYQPGVDVHGNPVVPADLNPPIAIPEVFLIPLELDLYDTFGLPDDPTLLEGDVLLGTVRLEGDRVTYNGQELTDPQSRALAVLCQRMEAR